MGVESWQAIRAFLNADTVTTPADDDAAGASSSASLNDAQTIPDDAGASSSPSSSPSSSAKPPKADDDAPKPPKASTLADALKGLPQRAPHISTPIDPIITRVSNAPTPGGVGILVLALVFFLFAIVPVGPQGETRLLLMWKALLGNVTLPTDAQPTQVADLQTAARNALTAVGQTEANAIASATGTTPATVVTGAQAAIGSALDAASGGLLHPWGW